MLTFNDMSILWVCYLLYITHYLQSLKVMNFDTFCVFGHCNIVAGRPCYHVLMLTIETIRRTIWVYIQQESRVVYSRKSLGAISHQRAVLAALHKIKVQCKWLLTRKCGSLQQCQYSKRNMFLCSITASWFRLVGWFLCLMAYQPL